MALESLLWPSLTHKINFHCPLAWVLMTKCNLITREKTSGCFLNKTFFFSDLMYKVLPCMNYIQCFKAHSNLSLFQWFSFVVLYKASEVTLSNCYESTWCMSKPRYSELVTRHLSSKKPQWISTLYLHYNVSMYDYLSKVVLALGKKHSSGLKGCQQQYGRCQLE